MVYYEVDETGLLEGRCFYKILLYVYVILKVTYKTFFNFGIATLECCALEICCLCHFLSIESNVFVYSWAQNAENSKTFTLASVTRSQMKA